MNVDWCLDESHLNAVCQLPFGHRGHHQYKGADIRMTWTTIANTRAGNWHPYPVVVADQYPACNLGRKVERRAHV